MKSRHPGALVLFCLMLVGAWIGTAAIAHSFYRYSPSWEHESAFLRNYNVRPVIESFAFKDDPVGIGSGVGSSAGRKFVTIERQIRPMFAIRTDTRLPLMAALSDDLAEQLVRNGGTILSRSGDSQRGFRLAYRDGTSAGSVTLLPLEDSRAPKLGIPLPEGIQPVHAHIVISEKWFPDEAAAIQASAEPR